MTTSRPRLAQVARQAGVSPATASRVLNNTAPVAEASRMRVLEAAAALGYVATWSRGAASTTGLIAFIISDILNPFFPEIVRAVEEDAAADGMGLLLCNSGDDRGHGQRALRLLADHHVDGIVVCASRLNTSDLIALHECRRTPMVVINRRMDHPRIPSIIVDFESATYRATRHLLGLQHTRIAYLAGAGTSDASRARRRGIELALGEASLSLRPEWCPITSPNVEGGFQ
ncbi:MAG TPA: LacI family DNA-binding transcriptional regulator, partial [Chloroflexia bacterium]|nr:LacI family DNA-binding transcriptional regulator [Chloroflexia bacterium]